MTRTNPNPKLLTWVLLGLTGLTHQAWGAAPSLDPEAPLASTELGANRGYGDRSRRALRPTSPSLDRLDDDAVTH